MFCLSGLVKTLSGWLAVRSPLVTQARE